MRQTVLINNETFEWYIHSSFTSPAAVEQFFNLHKAFKKEEWTALDWEFPYEYSIPFRNGIDVCIGRLQQEMVQKKQQEFRAEVTRKQEAALQAAKDAAQTAIKLATKLSVLSAKTFAIEWHTKRNATEELLAVIEKTDKEATQETRHLADIKIAKIKSSIEELKLRMEFVRLTLAEDGFENLLEMKPDDLLKLDVNPAVSTKVPSPTNKTPAQEGDK